MKLVEALLQFLEPARLNNSTVDPQSSTALDYRGLSLLAEFFSPNSMLTDITPSSLRDFLSHWYVERASGSRLIGSRSGELDGPSSSGLLPRHLNKEPANLVPEPLELLSSIEKFFGWCDRQLGVDRAKSFSPLLNELGRSLPRALEITNTLTSALRGRGGAFAFPEFLTSFEEGGSSQYDIDVPGNVGAIDGYFRVIRVDGVMVEAEEQISEERVWPIEFPAEVAAMLDDQYIVNLELVRESESWQIAACGFTYPPGTDIS